MVKFPAPADNLGMEGQPVRRVVLVQRRIGDNSGPTPVRRYSLARVGPSTVSALGADRFERMEEIAGMDEGGSNGRVERSRGDDR
jgi:hypothetical protein